jgi:hypothetical protein
VPAAQDDGFVHEDDGEAPLAFRSQQGSYRLAGGHFTRFGSRIESLDGKTARFEPVETFLERLEGAIVDHAYRSDDRRRDATEDGDERHGGLQIRYTPTGFALLIGRR